MKASDTVAFFDFDGTLTTSDSLMPFLKHVLGGPRYFLKVLGVSPVLAGYFAGLVRNDVAKQILLTRCIGGMAHSDLTGAGESFSQAILPHMMRPEGLQKLQWHKDQGHCCVLVSASLDIYLRGWSQQAGFDDLICSSLVVNEGGLVTGALDGTNCHGVEKVKRVESWLSDSPQYQVTYSYGDSQADRPLLEYVSMGYLWQGADRQFVQV